MQTLQTTEACVDVLLASVGKRILLATPLGIGKPNHLLNALYRRAKADRSIELVIHTALTMTRPRAKSELEQRFLGPIVERVFGNYPDLEYELDRLRAELPPNVRVIEFYFQAGKHAHTASAQRDYISSNYTHVARDLFGRGVNVLAQQICAGVVDGCPRLSLSCNPDLSIDMARGLLARRKAGEAVALVGQLNDRLPFMFGDAVVAPEFFDYVVDDESEHYDLFAPPKTPVDDADFMIGLYASALVRDGGELQIGIGALGDALVYGLKLRHEDNAHYVDALARLGMSERFATELTSIGSNARFERGLFAATEMLVDGFMPLFECGILKRKVYDDMVLSRLLNQGRIDERVTPELLDLLRAQRAIHSVLTEEDLAYLIHFGILQSGLKFAEDGSLELPGGERIIPDLDDGFARQLLHASLGSTLKHGAVVHAGFFLGPNAFYQWLRELPEEKKRLIDMRSVTRINQLYGHEEIDRLQRRDARFVNTAMKISLLGAAASDALADGTVISGVGGQYNFVAMAHELPGGRSILQVRSTRLEKGRLVSNLVWNYGHTTIPNHLRDVVITEFGIADLRGKTDEECVRAMLNICDSRFQYELLQTAKRANKLAPGYVIPDLYRNNVPAAYAAILTLLRQQGLFPAFPFGTDLTQEEQTLARALRRVQSMTNSPKQLFDALIESAANGGKGHDVDAYLRRMELAAPRNAKEHLFQRLIAAALRADA
ncbi:MAG TPA: acetyl-CoA hydrolase/transferase C-terminal domain-containing protein [Polyangiales bacterium]|jgi:acyl-CoA hydrolase